MKKIIAEYTKFGIHILVNDLVDSDQNMELAIPVYNEPLESIKENCRELAIKVAEQFEVNDIVLLYNRQEERSQERYQQERKIMESQEDNFMFDAMLLSCDKPFSLN